MFGLATVTLTVGMNLAPQLYRRPHRSRWCSRAASPRRGSRCRVGVGFAQFVLGYGVLFGLGAGVLLSCAAGVNRR